ncbi:hypothetical protein BD770DRAFT_235441 [Pilaira anomala]|nr:hypothetical protein BD770DRAFT_235441 [Pilaira anomala]
MSPSSSNKYYVDLVRSIYENIMNENDSSQQTNQEDCVDLQTVEVEEETLHAVYHKVPRFSHGNRFDLARFDDNICRNLFRFTYYEMKRITAAIGMSGKLNFRNNDRYHFCQDDIYVLAIVLKRLSSSWKYSDLVIFFNIITETDICIIFNSTIFALHDKYHQGLNKSHLNKKKT